MSGASEDYAETAEELYEAAPCGYLSTLPDGVIVRANRTFLTWIGRERDELVGVSRWQDLLTAGGRIFHDTHIAPLLRMQGSINEIALDFVAADGGRRPALVNAVQRRGEGGTPIVNRVTIFDATDRRRYERELLAARTRAEEAGAALKRLNDDLEERIAREVAVRVAAEEALRQAQKMEALGQLAGGVAHDFNNLLGVIVANVDVALMRASDEPVRRHLDNALKGAERAEALIHRLLTFARKTKLVPRPVALRDLVLGMEDLFRQALDSSVALDLQVEGDLPAAVVDPGQLELALMNLAVNARHAMPGGGRFEVSAAEEAVGGDDPFGLKPGRYLRLSCRDTGIGMDEDTLKRATEPFFTTKPAGVGTGLGLAMAQALATQSGGRLALRSRLGEGTTVEMWLPAA